MSRNIKGITIEIGGNTTKLQDALKDVNKTIYATNSELKNLTNALKLDPKNTELLAQKQEVLKKNVQATTEKLNQLKEAQRQMGNYNSLTEEQKENYRALSVEIAKSENALKSMNKELEQTKNIDFSKMTSTLKKVGDVALEVSKKVAQVTAAVGTALAGLVTAGVKSYADLEQNLGGVETLFGKSANKVIQNAKKAYKTAGVSANEYMAGVTSFSASLLQSLSGDTEKAADVADMAFRDMSDNANKFGSSMESITNAYQGFSKGQYQLLDNLKLGYGGTKTEMERLLKDAEKISGVKYDIKNLSDVYNAIHVIQGELGVTGTTALEAETTISGSAKSMKSAFDNFLNGSGGAKDLSKTIITFLKNIGKAISKLAPDILDGIVDLINELTPKIIELLMDLAPSLIDTAFNIMNKIVDSIVNNVEPLIQMTTELIKKIANFIIQNLPVILQAGITIITELVKGISKALPDLIPAIIDGILLIVETLIDNIDLVIDAGVQLIIGLAEGLIKGIPKLIEKAPVIITKLIEALLNLGPKLLDAGVNILVEIGKGLIEGIPQLLSKIPEIIEEIVKKFGEFMYKFFDIGKNIVGGIIDGIKSVGKAAWDGISWVGGKIADGFTSFFGINSPSKLMHDKVGIFIGEGITEGIVDGINETENQVNLAMSQLANGIETSVNPTINPTANSNPLILQIENFNNNRESDIQQLSQELEFYRKNSALARGGN